MKFIVTKASDFMELHPEDVEINTLDELKDFQLKNKHSIIINFDNGIIKIYDDYIE